MPETDNNPFTVHLNTLITRVADLRYYQFFIESQNKRARSTVEKDLAHFEKKGWPTESYMFGAALTVADIFEKSEWVTRCPTQVRSTSGRDVLQMNGEAEKQFNAFIVVQLFEATEQFLRSAYREFLVATKGKILLLRSNEFHRAFPGWEQRRGCDEYYSQYAAFASKRNANDALIDFDQHLAWERATVTGCFGMSFHDFIRVLGEIRHCIVHEHGKITEERLAKLNEEQSSFLNAWIADSLHGKERLILPEGRDVSRCFERIITYARGLYVLLSDFCSMPDETDYFKLTPSPS